MENCVCFDDCMHYSKVLQISTVTSEEKLDELERYFKELNRAYANDVVDDFYVFDQDKDDPSEKEMKLERANGLDDVIFSPNSTVLTVWNFVGELVGKIGIHFNDRDRTVNCMYLYVCGDRRRRIGKEKQRRYIYGAHLIWFFVAREAFMRYGEGSKVLITYPRPSVLKYINQLEGHYVELDYEEGKAIESRVKLGCVLREGALFDALHLMQSVECLENFAMLKRDSKRIEYHTRF